MKRFFIFLWIFISVLCIIYTFKWLFFTKHIWHFKTSAGKLEYFKYYEEIMKTIPSPTSTHQIETAWGDVFIYEWRNQNAKDFSPIILLSGHSSGTPMWSENLEYFTKNHTVFAIDTLWDVWKSIQNVPLENGDDSLWIAEAIEKLWISKAHFVGHSFWAGYLANFAVKNPEKVESLTLLEPAIALNSLSFKTMFWATISSIWLFPESWKNYALAQISWESSENISSENPLAQMIKVASTEFSSSLPSPKTLSTEELKNINFPVYVALSDKSAITGKAALESAKLIPNATVKVWENTTHSLPMEVKEELSKELEIFWKKIDFTKNKIQFSKYLLNYKKWKNLQI